MFLKLGELLDISKIETLESVASLIDDLVIQEHFTKVAKDLKKIAPRAEDFLYFSCVMMSSAEASAYNEDGTSKLNRFGEAVKVGWNKDNGSWKWITNDDSIKPYRNSNGDIFPEEELVKAYRKWVGKPLCIDHKSDSVDHVRGFIVDTYYDRNLKRVIALCALDKHNYPDLARKVATGYSTCVSMGTAVGKAVCSDCGQVARTEKDFCNHMRSKSCYGEINVDLSPIELSIVVNGADPQAKIKHIIAAANTLNAYVQTKEKEISKLANSDVNMDHLINLRKDLDESMNKLAALEATVSEEKDKKDTNDLALKQEASAIVPEETELPNTDFNIAPPAQRFASEQTDALIKDFQSVATLLENKLAEMKQNLEKLTNHSKEENNMSGSKDKLNKSAYFQGTEEPTPGQAKYPAEPLNDKLRTDGDKQMEVADTGPVDGLYPGDLEKKKMLARAQAEERALRRQSAVSKAKEALEKKSYWQGGGGVNEPTPGKTKYPADKMNEQLREKEDKQMVGAKPFPGVGPVDGLYPNDLKIKEQMKRANLKVKFVKAANADGTENIDASAWQVQVGDELIDKVSVSEISGNRSLALYDVIATRDFGTKLLDQVKAFGVDRTMKIYRKAQEAPAAAPAPAPAPEAAAPADAGADAGAEGDPKAVVTDLMDKTVSVVSDLKEAVDTLTGEQAEMGDLGGMGATASTKALNKMRVELNGALVTAMKEAVAELTDHKEELSMISSMYDKNAVSGDLANSIVQDAIADSKTALADSFKLISAFVKYARGTQAIEKRASLETELNKLAGDESMGLELSDMGAADSDLMDMINDADTDLASLKEEVSSDEDMVSDSSEDEHSADMVAVQTPAGKTVTVPEGSKVTEASEGFDLTTKAGRSAQRAKLASEMFETSPHLHEAHPKGGTTTELDVKPQGNLAEVEDLDGVHDAMMDVATAPPKVRKEAESIQALILKGELAKGDVDKLVSLGLDKDAVAYWKKFYGEAGSEGSQFATELVKEHAKAKMDEELAIHKVKLARAFELTYDMVDRGLVSRDKVAINTQVEDIMKFNDEGFDSLKRVVAKHEPTFAKTAGRMPQVGLMGSAEVSQADSGSMFEQLNAAFSKNSKRQF